MLLLKQAISHKPDSLIKMCDYLDRTMTDPETVGNKLFPIHNSIILEFA